MPLSLREDRAVIGGNRPQHRGKTTVATAQSGDVFIRWGVAQRGTLALASGSSMAQDFSIQAQSPVAGAGEAGDLPQRVMTAMFEVVDDFAPVIARQMHVRIPDLGSIDDQAAYDPPTGACSAASTSSSAWRAPVSVIRGASRPPQKHWSTCGSSGIAASA